MNEDEFWRIISLLDWNKIGDDESIVLPAVDSLTTKSLTEIASFEEILCQKLYQLDTMNHAKHIGQDAYQNDDVYFSPDVFLYARCCVVANGKTLFDKIVCNPRQFPQDMEFESLLYLSDQAIRKKTGEDSKGFDTSVSYETFSNIVGWTT